MTVQLVSPHAAAVVDLDHGCDIVHFGLTSHPEDNVLAAYDWRTPLPARTGGGYGDGSLDWLSEYRGGWQLLTPSAGAPSEVDGISHPFHGEVSRARWSAEASSATTLKASVGTHGPLSVRRTIALDADRPRLTATTVLSNETTSAGHAILVEHIAFRGGGAARASAPATSVWRHDPASPEQAAAPDAVRWADSGLADPAPRGGYRLASLIDGNEGWMTVTPSPVGPTIRVEWDPERLPFAWHWQERGSEGFPWFGRADITAIEPASASASDGLAAAVERGESWRIAPGGSIEIAVSVQIERVDQ